MKSLRVLLAAFLALAVTPARATDEHDYARDEYAIIRDGLAPNKQMSLASHADPESDGHGIGHNFHVWLMAEPAHRKLARLPGIGPESLSRHRAECLSRVLVGGFAPCRGQFPQRSPRARTQSLSRSKAAARG